jgi:hypothetical protein
MTLEKVQGHASDQPEMTGDMAAQCQPVVDEFTTLQNHFDMMMKLIRLFGIHQFGWPMQRLSGWPE